MKPFRIIGIGNDSAGDDAVGVIVARQLKAYQFSGVDVVEAGLAGIDVLDLMEGAGTVILVDAVQSGCKKGTTHCLEIPRDLDHVARIARYSSASSTHAFGLAESLILGNALGTLPPRLTVYGIELGRLVRGAPLSAEVSKSAQQLVAKLIKELKTLQCTNLN